MNQSKINKEELSYRLQYKCISCEMTFFSDKIIKGEKAAIIRLRKAINGDEFKFHDCEINPDYGDSTGCIMGEINPDEPDNCKHCNPCSGRTEKYTYFVKSIAKPVGIRAVKFCWVK